MAAYYNEIDPYAAQWLRNLIDAGHIAPGYVDERSIEDVTPNDIKGYTQCHFFAGIGVWSLALRMAGWSDDRPVWTGSCPCQPFSQTGKKLGTDDQRHLWPAFFWLIKEQAPVVVFGEQVGSKDGLAWLDLVQADLEGEDYTTGATDLCAAGFGAPHIRQRLYWVGESKRQRLERYSGDEQDSREKKKDGPTTTTSFWSDCEWVRTWDGKRRPIQPGSCPMVNGATQRVGRLRAYGNAIVPQVASGFIEAYMETANGTAGIK